MRRLASSCFLLLAAAGLAAPADARHRFDRRAPYARVTPDAQGGAEGWSTYVERASGMSVDYPASIFSVDAGRPERGTGKRLRTPDGRAELTLYAAPNEGQKKPSGYLEKYLVVGRRDLDYFRVTDRFFAISGIRNDRTFYSRCNFSGEPKGPMQCVYIEYPKRETKSWDGIVTRISRSLREGASQAD